VSPASEALNLELDEVMCCLVGAATHQRVQRYVSMGICWIHLQTEETEDTQREKIYFSAVHSP